jgi:hypothetical protein
MTERPLQVPIVEISVEEVLSDPGFRRGFVEARTGKAPTFDGDDASWQYERGRLFGIVAPRSLSLRKRSGELNPKDIKLFKRACSRAVI